MTFCSSPNMTNSGSINLVDYDQNWPKDFLLAKRFVVSALGDIPHSIHHIGSTAVPNLCAKPKIDIDITFTNAHELRIGRRRMEVTHLEYHGDPHHQGMWTFTTINQTPGYRLYLCAMNTVAHLDRLLFRDLLRCNPSTARSYGALKRSLARQAGGDWNTYNEGKRAFIADVIQRSKNATARN